eukprot:TRINITY_DN2261_c0_g1_i2.p2 TRINITY_DN2261_c0_g1~~TRINITY_DN2261_c0_g1_i2.p2  ORF type:complete len:494 (+),score=135.88 TRINITY_DN2261_c0_g1_i2:1767-3248(+)
MRFFDNLDGVCNALDNVDARLYVDSRCVYYRKPLLESGTLGTKANVQVIVPHLTESYGSSRDPPEKSIPMCTLKNFPYQIEHTIQWARDWFEGVFKQAAEEANAYAASSEFLPALMKQPIGQRLASLELLFSTLVTDRPRNFDDCIRWARDQFEELFVRNIMQLLHTFPIDMVTATGGLFWSAPKRAPAPLRFDGADPLHMQFIFAAATLRAATYSIPPSSDMAHILKVATHTEVKPFVPKSNVKIQVKDDEPVAAAGDDMEDRCRELVGLLAAQAPPASLQSQKLLPIEFEKDDDTNHHLDAISAVGNLRARAYTIAEVDKHKAKIIAGKIIPAIATTTASATGLVCLELYKLIQKKKLEEYKNAFVNLALPFFGFSEPIAPPHNKMGEWKWNLWDRIDIEGDLTLQEFIDTFQEKHHLEVTMLSSGSCMLFMNFMPKPKLAERLPKKITELLQSIAKVELSAKKKYVVLEICCSNDDGDDVETPYVRLKVR